MLRGGCGLIRWKCFGLEARGFSIIDILSFVLEFAYEVGSRPVASGSTTVLLVAGVGRWCDVVDLVTSMTEEEKQRQHSLTKLLGVDDLDVKRRRLLVPIMTFYNTTMWLSVVSIWMFSCGRHVVHRHGRRRPSRKRMAGKIDET